MFYISIEGVIASGKSSLLNYLKQHCSSELKCFSEPIDLFSHFNSHNPIQRAYASPSTDSAVAQLHIVEMSSKYYSKPSLMREDEGDGCILITERSAFSPFFFIEAGYLSQIYSSFVYDYLMDKCFERMYSSTDVILPTLTIILDLDLEECEERIKKRGRVGEDGISLEYQKKLKHSMLSLANRYLNYKVLPIKPSDSVETVAKKLFQLIRQTEPSLCTKKDIFQISS